MKTKDQIKSCARELFNRHGVVNVTLRDVAAQLQKSYGNITYHYANKEQLLLALYADLQVGLTQIGAQLHPQPALLQAVLQAPVSTFVLSRDYRFLYADFIELQRHFPELMAKVQAQQAERMAHLRGMLLALQQQGMLRNDLGTEQLDYLMKLSGLVRTYFFVEGRDEGEDCAALKAYCSEVNALLWPYLSKEGLVVYESFVPQMDAER